jgi:hypothetical protein
MPDDFNPLDPSEANITVIIDGDEVNPIDGGDQTFNLTADDSQEGYAVVTIQDGDGY